MPSTAQSGAQLAKFVPAAGLTFFLVAAGFAAYAFVPSGLAAHLLAMFGRAGIDPATAVLIGALFGPSQVAARLCELVFGGNMHPLNLARVGGGADACRLRAARACSDSRCRRRSPLR